MVLIREAQKGDPRFKWALSQKHSSAGMQDGMRGGWMSWHSPTDFVPYKQAGTVDKGGSTVQLVALGDCGKGLSNSLPPENHSIGLISCIFINFQIYSSSVFPISRNFWFLNFRIFLFWYHSQIFKNSWRLLWVQGDTFWVTQCASRIPHSYEPNF